MTQPTEPWQAPPNLAIQLDEYKTLRDEALTCNKNAQGILNWGFSTSITLFSAGLASLALPRLENARVLFFMLPIPVYVTLVFAYWFGEVVRQQRADSFLCELEERINAALPGDSPTRGLSWHHHWLRQKTDNPLQGLQHQIYANIALGFLMFISLSEVLSVWTFCLIDADWSHRLAFLLGPVAVWCVLLKFFHGQAMQYFRYDLFALLLRVPWLSFLIVVFRVGGFVSLGLHVAGRIALSEFVIGYLIAAVVATDILDGYLVRLYAPRFRRSFRVLDSLVDNLGLGGLVLTMLLHRAMPAIPASLILLRQGIVFAVAAVMLMRRRIWDNSEALRWNRLFYLWAAIVGGSYLCAVALPEPVLSAGLVVLAAASLLSFAWPDKGVTLDCEG